MAALDGKITIGFERRPCYYYDRKAMFHMFFVNSNDKAIALIEFEDGTMKRVDAVKVRFVDDGEFNDVAWPDSAERE